MTISRRAFVRRAAAASVGFASLRQGFARGGMSPGALQSSALDPAAGFGPLIPDPLGVFDLPRGFSYTIISRAGDLMDDGLLTPGRHDGMASFSREGGRIAIVCNHEVEYPAHGAVGPWGEKPELRSKLRESAIYDSGSAAMGGTTTTIYNPKTREVEKRFLSLAGTVRNCAGGPTPWGSWLTCEESVVRKGDEGPGFFERDHGYVFEVPGSADELVEARPLRAMGRFFREAVCIDPRTGIVYMSEDRSDGLIYRFIPRTLGKLEAGGKLQALAVKDRRALRTHNWVDPDIAYPTVSVGTRF